MRSLCFLLLSCSASDPLTLPPPPPSVAIPTATASAAAPSACPADMVEVDGEFCAVLDQTCKKRRQPWQCAEFEAPSRCRGTVSTLRVCIDRYEYPNRAGELPKVMVSWSEAKAACAAIDKRLCTDAEWTLACEGRERLPFPYGYARDPAVCSIDKPSPRPNDKRLFSPQTQADELARLDKREPSGSRARCVSAFGAHDLTGNVDEWVTNESGRPYKSALKGGSWGEYRNACRPATRGHDEAFRYYQIGFRCCRDVR